MGQVNNEIQNQKPLTVARNDFMQGITDLINEMPMPFFVIEDCLKSIMMDIHTLAVEQEKRDREIYNKKIEESKNVNDGQ